MALTPVQEEVVEWLANGETGLSSMTMAFWLGFRQPYHPTAGTGGFLLTPPLNNPPFVMPISDLNPNIAAELEVGHG